jgi:hypothetical protein
LKISREVVLQIFVVYRDTCEFLELRDRFANRTASRIDRNGSELSGERAAPDRDNEKGPGKSGNAGPNPIRRY